MSELRGIALKVTYNDNDGETAQQGQVGFRGVCSDATILLNGRQSKKTNCADDMPCARYVRGGMKPGTRPVGQSGAWWCYESRLLRGVWSFGAGVYHQGDRTGLPIPIKQAQRGDIALLTTRFPGQSEAERSVFAIYRIKTPTVSPQDGTRLESDGTMEVLLPASLARDIRYWKHVDATPDWRTGLFRYTSHEATSRLLAEVAYRLGDHDDRDVILRAIGVLPVPPAAGGWRLGGEGDAHRALKLRVAQNPSLIGLPVGASATIEPTFISGDRVDIAFDVDGRPCAVVEIETYFAEPGVYQAIKYRALMEAEHGLPLGSGHVSAVLVAHACDERARVLADRYGVRVVIVAP